MIDAKTKEEILKSVGCANIWNVDIWYKEQALKAMDEYAKQEMIALIEGISRQPIQCYSEKIRGQEPKFYLGRSFVEDLIKRIKESK